MEKEIKYFSIIRSQSKLTLPRRKKIFVVPVRYHRVPPEGFINEKNFQAENDSRTNSLQMH